MDIKMKINIKNNSMPTILIAQLEWANYLKDTNYQTTYTKIGLSITDLSEQIYIY